MSFSLQSDNVYGILNFYLYLKNRESIPGDYEGIYDPITSTPVEHTTEQGPEVQILYKNPILSVPTKQYKPFSNTVKVPPLENPIILNPNYENISLNENNYEHLNVNLVESKRREKELAVQIIVEKLKHVQSLHKNKDFQYEREATPCTKNVTAIQTKKNSYENETQTEKVVEESVDLNDKKKGIKEDFTNHVDLHTIKTTAINIIEQNINKAVSVAEEIKKEIDVELAGKTTSEHKKDFEQIQKCTSSKQDISKSREKSKLVLEKQAFDLGLQAVSYIKKYLESKLSKAVVIKSLVFAFTKFMVSLSNHVLIRSNVCNKTSFDENFYEERILSGSEMSRKFGKTPLEFTRKMDNVITEFETRTGIEQTQRRSRSRSRSTVKEKYVNDDDIEPETKTEGKNIYRAFVTEEWSEYYDLGKPEERQTIKSEKLLESTKILKETTEKRITEEKIVQEQSPQTYIAIVQSHVFTNSDAIIKDIVKNEQQKETADVSIECKNEFLTIQDEKRFATVSEFDHQIIKINKDKPIDKLVIVESIEDITPIEEYKSFADIQPPVTGVAVQKTTEVLENIFEKKPQIAANLKQARPSIESSNLTIASSEIVAIKEEKDDSFMLSDAKPRKSITLYEKPVKSIAETIEIDLLEPRVEVFEINKEKMAQSKVAIETQDKSIVQVSHPQIIEMPSRPLELEINKEASLKELIQTPVQTVAVNTKTFLNSPEIEFKESTQLNVVTPKVLVELPTKKVTEKSEVHVEEISETFTDIKTANEKQLARQTNQITEQTKKTGFSSVESFTAVAESSEIFSNENSADLHIVNENTENIYKGLEPMHTTAQNLEAYVNDTVDHFDKFKARGSFAETTREASLKMSAEVNEILVNESTKKIENDNLNKQSLRTNIELPSKTVAETSLSVLTESSGLYEKEKIETKTPEMTNVVVYQAVPEISEVLVEETSKTIDTPFSEIKVSNKKSIELIEEPTKILAENTVVIQAEPKPVIIELDEFKEKTPQARIADTFHCVAESMIPIVEPPEVQSLNLPVLLRDEAKIYVDKIEPTIITDISFIEPNDLPLIVENIKTKTTQPSIENPRLKLPETLEYYIEEPKEDTLDVPKIDSKIAKIDYIRSEAPEISELLILEPKCSSLKVQEVNLRHYEVSLQDTKLATPQIDFNVPLGPKDEIFVESNIVKQNAYYKVDSIRPLETSLTIVGEGIQNDIKPIVISKKEPKLSIEDNIKATAEQAITNVRECEKTFSNLSKSTEKFADCNVQSLVSLAEIAITPLEEVSASIKGEESISSRAKLSVQGSFAACTSQALTLDSVADENFHVVKKSKKVDTKIETFKSDMSAQINKIDIKESEVEIPEFPEEKVTVEDVSTDYTVELAEDSNTASASELSLGTEYIQKDIEYIENGMTSIIESVQTELHSKSHKKLSIGIVEQKVLESDSSKSISPTSPINDVYLFNVAAPYKKRVAEPTTVELDYKSAQKKRRYTQSEISVLESIALKQEISDSEEEIELIETEFVVEKHQHESEFQIEDTIEKHQQESELHIEDTIEFYEREQNNESIVDEQTSQREQQSIQIKSKLGKSDKSMKKEATKGHEITHLDSSVSKMHVKQTADTSIEEKLEKSSKSKITKRKRVDKSLKSQTQASQDSHIEIECSRKEESLKSSALYTQTKSEEIRALDLSRQSLQQDISILESNIESSSLFSSEQTGELNRRTNEVQHMTDVKSPSPPIQPPTPLTDEYMFRLTAPLPSREGTPVPRDCTSSSESEEEIRDRLIPSIDIAIEQRIYDPPLPTPPTSPTSPPGTERRKPVYAKPGLRGGGDRFDITKEEVLEIGRKSNLLASAIDKTIKSIEEYKSEVGIPNMEYHASSSEIITSSSNSCESKTVKEFKSFNDDNKVDVLIDKMVETSRRFSGEGSERGVVVEEVEDTSSSGKKEIVIPISKEYTETTEEKSEEKSDFSSDYSKKDIVKVQKMEKSISDQLLQSVRSMVDPNASIEERMSQMQAQIEELSRLPDLIQKTLDSVKMEFEQLNYQVKQKAVEIEMSQSVKTESVEQTQVTEQRTEESVQSQESSEKPIVIEVTETEDKKEVPMPPMEPDPEILRIIENRRLEAENKTNEEIMKERLSQELRIAAERLSPKLGIDEKSKLGVPQKPLPKTEFGGPAFVEAVKPTPGKPWKKMEYDDANLEQMLSETLAAQAEVIQGKAIGVNFKKYEKPPPPLDHLQHSEVYKAIHEMDQKPLKKVELLKPAVAASDYVERLRSVSPSPAKTLIEDCEV